MTKLLENVIDTKNGLELFNVEVVIIVEEGMPVVVLVPTDIYVVDILTYQTSG